MLAPAQGAGTRPPIPIRIRAPASVDEDETVLPLGVPIGAPTRLRKKKKLVPLAGIAALILVSLGGAFFVYQRFSEVTPPPPTVVPKPKAKPPGPTPSETLNALAAAPGKLIDNAQNAIAGKRNSEQSRIDAMANGNDPAGPSAIRTPAAGGLDGRGPAAPSLGKVATTMSVAPGITATTEIQASAEASPAFRSFVADAKVSGVYQGVPPRAFINGRLIRVGQLVEEGLSISFIGIDAENRQLLFKDRTGAFVSKRY
ncbi:MAG: hypothetical protein H7343_18570 [Undibacterium sp.]|nr:hypothetical protein [Opitutaceae bacterium]